MNIMISFVKEPEQVVEAMALVQRVIMEYEAPDYEQKGVNSFLDYIQPTAIQDRMAKGEIDIWCARAGEQMVGIIAMRPPCAVSLLFVEKSYHKQGIARQILEYAVKNYQKENMPVTVNSSPYAVEAYRRMGFTENGTEETVSGIRFQPMIRV